MVTGNREIGFVGKCLEVAVFGSGCGSKLGLFGKIVLAGV
jgi:hypothetical protein